MTSTPVVQKLAKYFTSTDVARYSIALSMPPGIIPSVRLESAENFFNLRSALGITGYPTTEEAAQSIRQTIAAELNLTSELTATLPQTVTQNSPVKKPIAKTVKKRSRLR